MKKKALLLVGLCAIGFCPWKAQAIGLQNIHNVSPINIEKGLHKYGILYIFAANFKSIKP